MNPLTIIKTDEQYFQYCDELEQLESVDDNSEVIEERIEHLLLLINDWDEKHSELAELDSVQFLKLLMKNRKVKSIDIQKSTGIDKTTLSHILNYRRGFSKNNIRLLAEYFKVNQDTFNRIYELKNISKKKKSASKNIAKGNNNKKGKLAYS